MRPRCFWTNRPGDDLVQIELPRTDAFGRPAGLETVHVSPAHARQARAFAERIARSGRLFLGVMLAGCLGLVGFAAAGWHLAAGASLGAMGLTAILIPCCTPQTVEMFGVRTSIVLARIAGLLLIALGAVIGSDIFPA